jgi:translocation and assembly module TamB
MKRGLRITLVVFLLPVFFVFWMLVTESGLNRIYQQTKHYLPDDLSIDKIEGRLIGPITLTGVAYQQDDMRFNAKKLVVDWHPSALLTAKIDIQLLHVQSLHIILPATDAEAAATTNSAQRQLVIQPHSNQTTLSAC